MRALCWYVQPLRGKASISGRAGVARATGVPELGSPATHRPRRSTSHDEVLRYCVSCVCTANLDVAQSTLGHVLISHLTIAAKDIRNDRALAETSKACRKTWGGRACYGSILAPMTRGSTLQQPYNVTALRAGSSMTPNRPVVHYKCTSGLCLNARLSAGKVEAWILAVASSTSDLIDKNWPSTLHKPPARLYTVHVKPLPRAQSGLPASVTC